MSSAYIQPSNNMPAPYPSNSTMNAGMQPQYQTSPMNPPPYYNAAVPPPIPVYAQPTPVVQHLGGFLGHSPQATQCPSCRQQIITSVRYENGGSTWAISFLICILGGFLGCCFIPFCVTSCQDAVHTCPSCHAHIGRRTVF
ncbi:unnamed protein product [Adineta steineri]|uniref:LITAF domain-containing protein n=1 Tax=Adineta steineri TaxID=433720 RepID=A0A814L079_9BILA|nr:unnamed protein product [Adineta steineri]CAF1184749.1 unnamed protein product [Adineta steineri]CAF3487715.1 unnamed protein product [Adineta steineri]CAF3658073.1 unnamed protein product [Adineta steineri]